jgi:hypothetical protein
LRALARDEWMSDRLHDLGDQFAVVGERKRMGACATFQFGNEQIDHAEEF